MTSNVFLLSFQVKVIHIKTVEFAVVSWSVLFMYVCKVKAVSHFVFYRRQDPQLEVVRI